MRVSYSMTLTVYKVLLAPCIIEKGFHPMKLNEEAQKANNKLFKRYRKGFARKISCKQTNEDVST